MNISEAKKLINNILDNVDTISPPTPNKIVMINEDIEENNTSSLDSVDEIEFEKSHKVGFCKIPQDIDNLPKLSISTHGFLAPKYVNNMGSASKTDNQGQLPWCAAYSAANWAECIKWKHDGYPTNINPDWIYKYAKSIDGDPNGDGTTLPAVLQALLDKGIFDKKKCVIKNIWKASNTRDLVKYAIFKFGAILGAFNITSEWYKINKNKTSVMAKIAYPSCGGHAVILHGYDENGVFIQNSWGLNYGNEGFLLLSWKAFDEQFLYASVLTNVLDDMKI